MIYDEVKDIIKNCDPENVCYIRSDIINIHRRTPKGDEYIITLQPFFVKSYHPDHPDEMLRITLNLNLQKEVMDIHFPTNRSFEDLYKLAEEKKNKDNLANKFLREFGVGGK